MKNVNCPTKQMPELLENSLSAHQTTSVEAHLENCEACRAELEKASGSELFWESVRDLSDDDWDQDWDRHSTSLLNARSTADHTQVDHATVQLKKQQAAFESVRHWLAPTDDPKSVGRIGTYEVSGLISSGGMGVVLKARDHSLDRVVAIKTLAPHLATLKTARQRFEREAKAAAAVKHNGIIQILWSFSTSRYPVFGYAL